MIVQLINLSSLNTFREYHDRYGISTSGYTYGLYGLELRDLALREAESIYNLLSSKGERIFLREISIGSVNLFLVGSLRKFKFICERISNNLSISLSGKLLNTIKRFENYDLTNYDIGNKHFEFNKIYVAGILNVTPDSFSDGGKYFNRSKAVRHAFKMLDEGADIIDIGGESSRPGAKSVDLKIEIERIIPVIKKILEKRPDTIISVDTTKEIVAKKALESGAKIINDISGGTFEPGILKVAAKYKAVFIIMHMKGTPENMQTEPFYDNVVGEVYDFLYEQIKKATDAGIAHIIVDPGIGFGKTEEHNFKLIQRLDDFKSLSYPIMIGVSRKSFIGKSLDLKVGERDIPMNDFALSILRKYAGPQQR